MIRLVIKAKAFPVGTVRTHGQKKVRKVAPGKWVPVSEGREKSSAVNYKSVDAKTFIRNRDAKLNPEFEAFVTKYSSEEYAEKGAKMYVSETGNSGYAITEDGDLISVFSAPGAHEGSSMIPNAIENGAKTLDCLGPVLPKVYAKYGFEVTDKIAWDDEYAPPNWNYEAHGRPDVFFMKYKGQKTVQKSQSEATARFLKLSEKYARSLFGDEVVNSALKSGKKK